MIRYAFYGLLNRSAMNHVFKKRRTCSQKRLALLSACLCFKANLANQVYFIWRPCESKINQNITILMELLWHIQIYFYFKPAGTNIPLALSKQTGWGRRWISWQAILCRKVSTYNKSVKHGKINQIKPYVLVHVDRKRLSHFKIRFRWG